MNDRPPLHPARSTALHTAPSRWFMRFHEQQHASFRLFCFPYAGGSASVFRRWTRHMDPRVDVVALQLPGRGPRFDEAPVVAFDSLVSAVTRAVTQEADATRFGFFGHSMGALLMFEVARRIAALGGRLPECMFASGRPAPHLADSRRRRSEMSDADFVEELRRLQGTPKEILGNAGLLSILMPVIRGDFALLDSWRFAESDSLNLPLYALAGRDDAHVELGAAGQWSRWTRSAFELITYPGGHFFLHEQEPQVVRDVSARVSGLLGG